MVNTIIKTIKDTEQDFETLSKLTGWKKALFRRFPWTGETTIKGKVELLEFIEEEMNRQLEMEAGDSNTLYEMIKKKAEKEKEESYKEGYIEGYQYGYYGKALDKLNSKDNGRIRTNGEDVS